ncbi:M48 family metalloprotease [Desulfobotulus sp. H1]|uniref:M48 family metalloprotease n=1 Tax=Desulfobotulus pelophilus TaxID=2823377 RepID=A0ABT3N5X2_9BACT|nr:M48 family metallopeptidase [Desulfobotulus pelophilus]MCW7752854.1 M48 family metalloprotease [Desulfobotulus pelophilus]
MSLLKKAVNCVFAVLVLTVLLLSFPHPALSLTLQEEEEIAEQFVRYIQATQRLVRDPVITEYVRGVGNRILATIDNPPFPMTFNVVLDPSYNAFAGPGGHIYVHSGLILAMEREEELAGIMGHEIAHVTCRHIAELVSRSRKVGLGTLAGMAAGILAAVGGASPDAAIGLIMGSQAAGQSAILSHTRENERQADERGLTYLTDAGYGGEGLLTMLRKIRSKEWYTTDDVPTYLRTHPGTEERIAFVASWLETRNSEAVSRDNPSDNDAFQRVRNRLLGRYGEVDTATSQLRRKLQDTPDDLSLQHALALALIRQNAREEALALMEKVARSRPMDTVTIADLGRIRYHADRPESAIPLLKNVAPETDDPEVFFDLGRAYTAVGNYEAAVKTFDRVLSMAPSLIGAHYSLGEAYGRMGRDGMSHYHLGRYHQGARDFTNADFHYSRSLVLLPEGSAESDDALKRRDTVRKQHRRSSQEKR